MNHHIIRHTDQLIPTILLNIFAFFMLFRLPLFFTISERKQNAINVFEEDAYHARLPHLQSSFLSP